MISYSRMGFMNILTFFGRKKLAKLYSCVRKLFFGRNGEASNGSDL